MTKKNFLSYILPVLVCFIIGCGASFGLSVYDRIKSDITPIKDGQTIDFSAYGFHLTVPNGFSLADYTTNNFAEGGNALFAGCAYEGSRELYLFTYQNETGDDISAYSDQEIVSYYVRAGMSDVRPYTFGGRPFISYLAQVEKDAKLEFWYTYETWNKDIQLTFETRMPPDEVLPILAGIEFVPMSGDTDSLIPTVSAN